MLRVGQFQSRCCQGISRRDLLRVGGLSLAGLSLADVFRQAPASPGNKGRGDVSCIFLWLDGGPSHFETFDPKPSAPDTIRGPYGVIDTKVPGIRICELLPTLAQSMDQCCLIRSMNHTTDAHEAIPMLSGAVGDNTSYGAVVAKLQGFRRSMPPYVHVGSRLSVGGGRLGAPYFPVEIADPTGSRVNLPQFALSADIRADRLADRRRLLTSLDEVRRSAQQSDRVERMDQSFQRAFDILTSTTVRDAFDITRERPELRNRFGNNLFGQSCLLARRLVEAGTRFVEVKWYDGPAWDAWDVHGADLGGMVRMEQHLCPRLDQGLSALLQDLKDRRLLDSTLVVVGGEFGRTPRINRYGARDHHPYCFTYLLTGGGAPRGAVIGASDASGSRPANRPVSPGEFAATLYRLLGMDTTDQRLRPFVRESLPVSEIVGLTS
jgi:hypothetical protein